LRFNSIFNLENFYYKFCRKIDLKLEEEKSLRDEATAAAQAYEDVNQEYSEYGNRARSAEMKVQQTEGELRYRIVHNTLMKMCELFLTIERCPCVGFDCYIEKIWVP
jgi:hypothetical protein